MTTWRTSPFALKKAGGVAYHDTRAEAEERALRVANKSGDWCAVEEVSDGRVLSTNYINPTTTGRRPR